MGRVGPLGRILDPRGLMPNPKTGTVTMDVKKLFRGKAGKIDLKLIKLVLHAGIGKVSFRRSKLLKIHEIIQTLIKLKPTAAKGYISKACTLQALRSHFALDLKEYNW
jgi:large subunit ribosomal protein L1